MRQKAISGRKISLQKRLYLVVVVLQLFMLAWQSTHLDCLDQQPTNKVESAITYNTPLPILVTKKQPFRLPNGLPLSPEHVRAFPVRSFPCFPAEDHWNSLAVQKSPAKRGFLYVKARKASSSTVAGVAMRIARKFAFQRGFPMCQVRFNHPMASKLQYSKRYKQDSFLWSVLREPTKRFMSEFFHFGYSRNFLQPTDQNIQTYMHSTNPSIENYYLRWLSVKQPFEFPKHHQQIKQFVTEIIQEYDFLGVSERLDESLVALQMILNLTTSDLLYLSAKVNGGWDDGIYGNQCYFIAPTFVSKSMETFFETSPEWYNFSVGDDLLYRAVNASLDRTIASFEMDGSFTKQLQRLRWALRKGDEFCRSNVTFPCSESGQINTVNDCLMWDSACGMDCLDRFAKENNL